MGNLNLKDGKKLVTSQKGPCFNPEVISQEEMGLTGILKMHSQCAVWK